MRCVREEGNGRLGGESLGDIYTVNNLSEEIENEHTGIVHSNIPEHLPHSRHVAVGEDTAPSGQSVAGSEAGGSSHVEAL